MMACRLLQYLVVFEKSANGWGAYVPDLPGLGVLGEELDGDQLIEDLAERITRAQEGRKGTGRGR